MANTLYLVGNGFDLQHGLKTRYMDYKNWLEEKEYNYKRYNISDENFNWSDFENQIVKYLDEPVAVSADINDLDELYKIRDYVMEIMKIEICSWIGSIEQTLNDAKKRSFCFDVEDCFINFNYTSTIEKVYGIEAANVLHIHGAYSQINTKLRKNIQKAFNKDDEETREMLKIIHGALLSDEMVFGGADTGVLELAEYFEKENSGISDVLREIATSSVKEFYFDECAKKAENFLLDRTVDRVVVIGSNYYGIDKVYYEKIFWKKYSDIPWDVFVYSNDDLTAYEE